jgi:hypothetical protein
MKNDFTDELAVDLRGIQSMDDICKQWQKIKPLLIAAQSILKIFLPAAAEVLGAIIAFFDQTCPNQPKPPKPKP